MATDVTMQLPPKLSDAEVKALRGEWATERHFDRVVAEDTDARDPEDGRLIFRFRKGVLPRAFTNIAWQIFGDIDRRLDPSWSRNFAAGRLDLERVHAFRPDAVAVHPSPKNPCRGDVELRSGKRLEGMCNPVRSYMAGYRYDDYLKQRRPCGFAEEFPRDWARAVPFFEAVGDLLDRLLPERASAMHRWCEEHSVKPAFTIGRTCLSTVAVNVNYDSAYHYDSRDMRDGYSTLTAIRVGGSYRGGYLVLPKYRVAIDVREGDVLFNQSHVDLHGNTPVRPDASGAKRVSFVTYLKEKLKRAENKA